MLSAPQRETDGDEVVQVFTGDSLEEAMAHAVATLGPDLTVRRARKVRKGLQGLAGKDRYEVVALAPRPEGGDALDDAFSALLHQAEREEADRRAAPAVAAAPAAPPPPSPTAPPPPPARAAVAATAPAPVPAPRAAAEAANEPAPRVAGRSRPRPAPPSAARTTPRTTSGTAPQAARRASVARPPAAAPALPAGWSRAGLRAAGLPRAVLAALPARDPRTDAAWITALAKAMATVLPPTAPLGQEHPVKVDGYGLAGVVGILEAAGKGFPPGTITYGGRTAPATPTELALAVRSELVR